MAVPGNPELRLGEVGSMLSTGKAGKPGLCHPVGVFRPRQLWAGAHTGHTWLSGALKSPVLTTVCGHHHHWGQWGMPEPERPQAQHGGFS